MARKTVLIAEDEADHMTIVRTVLAHEGYEVIEAVDGEEAVRTARQRRPDLVLMDGALPLLDGWDATAQIKGSPETAGIPVVLVTVHTQEVDLLRCETSGCDGYITKPTDPSEILAEVKRRIGPA